MWFVLIYALYLPFEELFLKFIPGWSYDIFRYGGEVILFGILYFLLMKKIAGGTLPKTLIDGPILVLLIWFVFSIIANDVPVLLGVLGGREYLRYILIFYIIVYSSVSSRHFSFFVTLLLLVGAGQIIAALAQMFGGDVVANFFLPRDIVVDGEVIRQQVSTLDEHGLRLSGTMVRYGIFGTFMSILFVYYLSFIYVKIGNSNIYKSLLILVAIILVATFSRKAWLASFLAFICISYIAGRKKTAIVGVFSVALVLLAGISVYGFTSFSSGISTNNAIVRALDIISPEYIAHTLERTRGYILTTVLTDFAKNSFFTGVGPGVVGSVVSGTAAGTNALIEYSPVGWLDAYDERLRLLSDVGFVNIFAQIGVVGVVAVFVIFWKLFTLGNILYQYAPAKYGKFLGISISGLVVIMIVTNFTSFSMSYRATSYYFWLTAGLAVSYQREYRMAAGKLSRKAGLRS